VRGGDKSKGGRGKLRRCREGGSWSIVGRRKERLYFSNGSRSKKEGFSQVEMPWETARGKMASTPRREMQDNFIKEVLGGKGEKLESTNHELFKRGEVKNQNLPLKGKKHRSGGWKKRGRKRIVWDHWILSGSGGGQRLQPCFRRASRAFTGIQKGFGNAGDKTRDRHLRTLIRH